MCDIHTNSEKKMEEGLAAPLEFTVECETVLGPGEHTPFLTAYLTKDVAIGRFDYVRIDGNRQSLRIGPAQVKLDAPADALKNAAPDAALCIQGFCHLENSNGERCIHRTGHCNVLLSALKESVEVGKAIDAPLSNRTSEDTPRGTVQVYVADSGTVRFLREQATFAPETALTLVDKNAQSYIDAFQEYRDRTDAIVFQIPPVRPDIPLNRLPFYAFNMFSAPPIAFMLFVVIHNPEDYYLNALRITLRRRNRDSATLSDLQLLRIFLDDDATSWTERGAVLCGVVTLFVNACPYITDLGLWTEQRTRRMGLRSVEEFARTVRLTLSGDCEDFTIEMVMELADILTGMWKSEAMRMLQFVRQQYVASIPLKMVTRPAAYSDKHDKIGNGGTRKPKKQFAMHNNVDLIPVDLYVGEQLRLSALADDRYRPTEAAFATNGLLLKERRAYLLRGNVNLGILVAEGTGMYRPDGGVDASYRSRKQLFKANPPAFALAKHTIREKARNESRFYLTTVSALVWDTFRLYTPETPTTAQIFYTTDVKGKGLVYAANHPDYVRADTNVGIYAAPPATPKEMEMMRHMQRYDHPIPLVDMMDSRDVNHLLATLEVGVPAEGVDEMWGLARLKREIARLGAVESHSDVYVDVHFPAATMNSARIADIWTAVQRAGIVIRLSYYLEPIARGLALVLLRFRCKRHFTL